MKKIELQYAGIIQLVVFIYCLSTISIDSGAEICLMLLMLISSFGITKIEYKPLTREEQLLVLSLFLYPATLLIGFAFRQSYDWPEFDAPSRFLLVIPIFLFLIRMDIPIYKYYRWGCALGCIGAAASATWYVLFGDNLYLDRAANYYINPVPFACISLILAFSALPDQSRKIFTQITLMICGVFGISAALATQSRATLLVIPTAGFLFILSYKNWQGRICSKKLILAILVALGLSAISATFFKERIKTGIYELASISGESRNSSIGIRLQLWNASTLVFLEHPLSGIGKGNLPQELKKLAEKGIITPKAAQYNHSHSELLFLLSESGLIGAFSVGAIYFGFMTAFARRLLSRDIETRSAAYAGLVTIVAYLLFGLADCMLTQTMLTSFLGLSSVLLFTHIRQRERYLETMNV